MNTTTPHWPSRVGVGDPPPALPNPQGRPEIDAATSLIAYLATNGCTQASIPVCTVFQTAYNTAAAQGTYQGQLTPDGQYGGDTQRALQNVMDQAQADAGAGPSQQAPQNCFASTNTPYATEPAVPALDVTPPAAGGSTSPTTVVVNPAPTSNNTALYIGVAAVAVAAVGAGIYVARRRRRRT